MILRIHKQKGSFMIEALVAISLAMIGLLGLLNLVVRSLSSNQIVVNRLVAAGLAAEGVETVKNLVDSNYARYHVWNAGIKDGVYELNYDCVALISEGHCERLVDIGVNLDALFNDGANALFYDDDNIYNYLNGQPTAFKRLITIKSVGENQMGINSIVRWSNRGRSFTINIEDHFFDWRR